jgi:hypothetical protein
MQECITGRSVALGKIQIGPDRIGQPRIHFLGGKTLLPGGS